MRFFFFLVTLFVLSFQTEKADAMDIQCKFYEFDWGFGSKNGCAVQSVTLTSPDDREITSVNGDNGQTYNDVWWFESFYKTFNNFPQNIKKIFPNVESVQLGKSNITTLTKSDMASLGPQLKRFSFFANKIEVLEKGFFDENPNLEFINFSETKIKIVSSGIFDKVTALTTLIFAYNPCHSGSARNDSAAVLTLISNIEGKCRDPKTTKKVKTEHEMKIEELTAEINQHKEELYEQEVEASIKNARIRQLLMRNEVLKQELAAVQPCDELHEVRDSLMSKLMELKEEFDTTKDMIKKTLVNPMNSLHAKFDTMDLKLDTVDGKLNATCEQI